MRGRKGIPTSAARPTRLHLFSSTHEPTAFAVLVYLKETGQALTSADLAMLIASKKDTTSMEKGAWMADTAEVRRVMKVLARTGMVYEDRSHWPLRMSFNQTAFEALEARLLTVPSIGYLDTATVEAMSEDHPLKGRVFPCPGNLEHFPILEPHFHVLPAGMSRPE